ncbi:MAG: hypothetical protein AAGA55_12870, partial [Planctomycetota bacterium]
MHRMTQAVRGVGPSRSRSGYAAWVLAQGTASILILLFFTGGMKAMVDLATTLSFLNAPVLARVKHHVVKRHKPAEARPRRVLRCWSVCSMLFLGMFGAVYVAWLVLR